MIEHFTEHFPGLIAFIPLMAALIAPALAFLSINLVRWFSILSILAAFISSLGAFYYARKLGTLHYYFGGWVPPWGIEYVVDPISAGIAALVAVIALLVAVFAGPYFEKESWFKNGLFYSLYLLILTGLMGMTLTGDFFNLFVFLEISALATYSLIALGGARAAYAAFRYLIIGTMAASFYLLGVGYIYAVTGTLNMIDIAERIQPLIDSPAVIVAVAFMVIGLVIKMAVFPLHGWLPDSYTYAPPYVSAFIAGVMTKVSAFVLFKISYMIIGVLEGPFPPALTFMGGVAAVGIIIGSVLAICQKDFRRMLAYSSVSQIGYVLLGISIGNTFALIGALLHIFYHAIMKSCLFLIAGGIKWRTGEHNINKYLELSGRMPLTMGSLALVALSMIGLPPTAGFFSKWYLALGALQADMWIYVVVIIVSGLLNLVYFFRVIENTFLRKRPAEASVEQDEDAPGKGALELPVQMIVPIVVLGASVLVIGIFNMHIVADVIEISLPGGIF